MIWRSLIGSTYDIKIPHFIGYIKKIDISDHLKNPDFSDFWEKWHFWPFLGNFRGPPGGGVPGGGKYPRWGGTGHLINAYSCGAESHFL